MIEQIKKIAEQVEENEFNCNYVIGYYGNILFAELWATE